MPTAQEWLAVVERVAVMETEMKEVKRQLNGAWWRWAITTAIAALAAYGAVLSAEILRHNGG